MKRRTFLKSIPLGIGTMTLTCQKKDNEYAQDLTSSGDSFYDNFHHPKAAAKPFFRWWWNDNRVTEKEVRRELRLMAEQGAGGVEINPIALPEIYQNLPGEKLAWLGREWNDVLLAAVDEAKKFDMIVDLIVGTGWPFGGTFVSETETIQGLELEVEKFTGPLSLEKKIGIPDDPDFKIKQIKLFPVKIITMSQGIDLTYHVEEGNILRVNIPNGEWNLYIVTWRNKFRDVLYGVKGADGPVLDHLNAEAVRNYLNHMSSVLTSMFGGSMGNKIRAMFCDSIELEGANWTTDLADEFRRRCDYDVSPYLPLILAKELDVDEKLADTIRRVRYDFSKTLAALFMERFVIPFHEWCLENGVVSRYQAYGHPWLYTDLLDGYLVPDIPEGDQWLYNSGWVQSHKIDEIRYAIWNKYASSGGHLSGKKIISCEAMTNTRGLWEVTLEYIKQATDLDFVGGINHLVLHGFNYSPAEAEFPGWIRFGTYFHENNTWWPYLKLYSDYAARLSQIFQDSQYKAQIAIMGPTPDVWSDHGLDRNPWNTTPVYLHDLWQAVNHHGYCSDYVNATILKGARFENGKLNYGPMAYDILLCCDILSLEPETAKAMLNFAKSGGKILFVNKQPSRSASFANFQENDRAVEETTSALLAEYTEHVKLAEYPEDANLTAWIGERLQEMSVYPAVRISNPDERLFMINYVKEDRDIYFFCNSYRDRHIRFEATFPIKDKTAWEWNAETGERVALAAPNEPINIKLKPLQSLLLIFDNQKSGEIFPHFEIDPNKAIEVTGVWQVDFQPVHGQPFERTLTALIDLTKNQELQHFSGTVVYKTQFLIEKPENILLDLGAVYDIAEVAFNGEPLGIRWWGDKQFLVKKESVRDINQLEIKVTTTLFNYIQSLRHNVVVKYWLERRKNQGLVPAGLVGPVRLQKIIS